MCLILFKAYHNKSVMSTEILYYPISDMIFYEVFIKLYLVNWS